MRKERCAGGSAKLQRCVREPARVEAKQEDTRYASVPEERGVLHALLFADRLGRPTVSIAAAGPVLERPKTANFQTVLPKKGPTQQYGMLGLQTLVFLDVRFLGRLFRPRSPNRAIILMMSVVYWVALPSRFGVAPGLRRAFLVCWVEQCCGRPDGVKFSSY